MKTFLTALTLISFTLNSLAQNWTGAVNSDWNNPSNWSATPTNNTPKNINPVNYTGAAQHPVISTNSNFTASTLNITNGGQLTINANLSTTDNVTVTGNNSNITVNSGTFQIAPSNNGCLIIDLGATMNINNGTINVGQRFITGENSITTMQNGTVTCGQRLLLDLGGVFNFNGGNITVAQTMALADGNANGSCQFIMNGGTLNVNGEIALENEFGIYDPTIIINGGTLNLNGDLIWFGELPGAGTPKFVMNGGTANISGIIQNMPLSTVNMYLKLDGNSQLNFSGTLIENIHPQDSIIQTGNSQLILNSTHSINNSGVIQADNVSTLFNGNSTLQGNGQFQFNTIQINANKTVNHLTSSVLKISGDVIANGTFITNNNEIELNGNINQIISGNSPINFHNLTINNNSVLGITLNNIIKIFGHLQLNSGKINSNNNFTITIEDNASSSAGNSVSFVNGPLLKKGNDSFIFPIGKNQKWRRIEISAPSTINDIIKAEYFDNSFSQITPVNSPLSAVSNIEYWSLERINSTSTVQIALYWEDASISAITDCNELSIARWNEASWDNIISTANGTCSGNGNGKINSNNQINDLGIFTFGYYSNVTSQNITICNGDSVIVGNNIYNTSGTYIDIFNDINNNDSIVITNLTVVIPDVNVTVVGNTLQAINNNANSYQWMDCNTNSLINAANSQYFSPTQSGNYAVIINQNGCIDTSTCYTIAINTIENFDINTSIQLYPNPLKNGQSLNITNTENIALIEIYDIQARLIYTQFNKEFKNTIELKLQDIKPGIICIKATYKNGHVSIQKIIQL